MKKLNFLIILFFLIPTFSYGESKIAVVNLFKIFQQSSKKKIIFEKLNSEFQSRFIELQNLEQDLNENIYRLNQYNRSDLYKNKRMLLENEIVKKREIYSKKLRNFEEESQRRQMEEKNKIFNYIKDIVREFAMREGYDFVINSEIVVYADRNVRDITKDILKKVK